MNTKKATKRALLTSVMALVMCVVMLVGTTFAWFTDTASTAVNKIQAGNLDIELVDKDGVELDSATALKWKTVDTGKVLWEPNCKYELEGFQIKNAGNLAVKYKVVLKATDITKTADGKSLLDVIDWTIKLNGDKVAEVTSDMVKDGLVNGVEILVDKVLVPEKLSGVISVTGHMDANAGNDYQGLEIGGFGITVLATQASYEKDSISDQYDAQAEYPTLTTAATITDAFPGVNFGSDNTNTDPVVLDGKGVTVIENWADYYFTTDTTIKGVTFKNGASFTAKSSGITVKLEDCTFYACDQDKAVAALGITDKTTGAGNGSRNNIVTNTGAGMCLNLEQEGGTSGVKLIVKDCAFVGENDQALKVYGDKYGGNGAVVNTYKARGHAIALNAISGGGTAGQLDSLLIEDCTINGVRGNAIQLYGKTGNITIKDTKINSWGVNDGDYRNANGTVKADGSSYAIRGDYAEGRTLTLSNVSFGLGESDVNKIGHVKLSNVSGYSGPAYSGNTDGTKEAGTYFNP